MLIIYLFKSMMKLGQIENNIYKVSYFKKSMLIYVNLC